MADRNGVSPREGSWLQPEVADNDLRRYANVLRERVRLIVFAVVVTTLVAVLYVKTATPVYTAESQLLVTPLSGTDTSTLSGLGVITSSSDPTQDIETAASLVLSRDVAKAVKAQMHLGGSPESILAQVTVQPLSQSHILSLSAQASSASKAAALANNFAQAALAQRLTQFRARLDQKIAALNAQIAATKSTTTTATGTGTSLQAQLASLQAFRAGPLPDMSISRSAVAPAGRTSPRATLSVGAAIIGGLVLGILAAFALQAFDSTLRREEQLRRLFRLPVLARIPFERGSRRGGPRPRLPDTLSPAALEGYRTLRAMLLALGTPSRPTRSILVTSASPREGKTTSAINLAVSLAQFGASTILIEADTRLPSIGDALGASAPYGLTDVLTGRVEFERALVSSPKGPKNLKLLLGQGIMQGAANNADALFLPTVLALIEEAERQAEHVVIDSPPLVAVIDALELAAEADMVLIVARLGSTDLRRLSTLGGLLSGAKITPAGIALIGAETPGETHEQDYYQLVDTERRTDRKERPARTGIAARIPLLRSR